jgi:hypothetical protein
MTQDELDRQIERTLKRNRAASSEPENTREGLFRTAERFDPVFDRALERLRQIAN